MCVTSYTCVVYGGGGFGRELLDVLESLSIGAVEDRPVVLDPFLSRENQERLRLRGYRTLSSLPEGSPHLRYLVGVGAPLLRRELADAANRRGLIASSVVHRLSTLGSYVEVGQGVIVCALARVSSFTRLGSHVHVNPRVVLGANAEVHDFVSLNPAVVVEANAVIGEGCLIGARAIIGRGVKLGPGCVVGAAAVVVEDVPAGNVVIGNPARPVT